MSDHSTKQSPGRAWVFGDGIDTDVLAPGIYMKGGIEELAKHCLEGVDAAFAADVRLGDVVVAGENFGMGSSREQAAMVLNELGVAAVVAKSYARIFYRNAMNLALPVLVCDDLSSVTAGDQLTVDPTTGIVSNISKGIELRCDPIPDHLMLMIKDGGLLPHLKKKLAKKKLAGETA